MIALISTIEPREQGYRVAEVVQYGMSFPVSVGLFWQPCPSEVVADQYWFDPSDNSFKEIQLS